MTRLRYIDALRGIGIMLVIMSHSHPYFAAISNYKLSDTADHIISNGDKGVTLFFLMSAYTLCLSLSSKMQKETHPVRNYFIRRVFRIVPMYYFAIIVILLVGINAPTIGSVISNFLFVHGFNPNWVNSTVPGGWSVGIEVIFYLVFPLLFFRIKSLRGAINVTLISMIGAKFVTSFMFKHPPISDGILWGVFTYENFISQLPVFLMGVCLFHIMNTDEVWAEKSKLYTCYFFITVLVLVQLLGGNVFKDHYLYALAFAFSAYALSKYQTPVIVNKFTVFIGKLSYSIYLVHLIIANLLVKYHFNHYSSNATLEVVIRFCIILAISTAISYLTYKFIEVPFQSYGKRLIQKLEHKKDTAELDPAKL